MYHLYPDSTKFRGSCSGTEVVIKGSVKVLLKQWNVD